MQTKKQIIESLTQIVKKLEKENKSLRERINDLDSVVEAQRGSRDPFIDDMSKDALFDEIRGKLPKLYDVDNPADIFGPNDWYDLVSREALTAHADTRNLKNYFEEMPLSKIKDIFRRQLWNYYYIEKNNIIKHHSEILLAKGKEGK